MNWYIGQKVVCITKKSEPIITEGRVYTIKDIKPSWCSCNSLMLKVDDRTEWWDNGCYCVYCRQETSVTNWHSYHLEIDFRPLDEWQEAEKAVEELLNTVEA